MTRTKFPVLGVFLATLLSLVAAACAPGAQPTPTPTAAPKAVPAAPTPTTAAPAPAAPTPTPKPATLKFGTTGAVSYAGVYIAIEKGFFKEQGIEIEPVQFRAVTEMVAPLGTGQVDVIGMPLSTALLQAAERGIELKLVADGTQDLPKWGSSWVVLRKDLADSGQVKTPADLKGMKIAIPSPGSYAQMIVELALAEGGLKPDDAELVVLPHADQAAGLQNKAIAAGFTVEPFIARGVQEGFSLKWIPDYKYFNGKVQGAFIVFGPELARNKDLGQRWMTAYLKGVRAYLDAFEKRQGRDEVVNILIKQTTVKDPKLFEVMELPYLDPNGLIDKKSMDAQYKWFVDKGVYQGKKTFDDIMDLSFAEYASQKLGKR